MSKFEYIPATLGAKTISLDGATAFVGNGENIRSRRWARELGKSDLLSAGRFAREITFNLTTDFDTADSLRIAADADMINRTPGIFQALGEWKQRGYILESNVSRVHFGWVTTSITAALLDGAWWRIKGISLTPGQGTTVSGGLDYPYDYEHGYSQPTTGGQVNTNTIVPCVPRIIFYGAASNPYIIISGNKYEVDVNVASGARVEVDGKFKTVKHIAQDGTVIDAFADAHRGSGEGSGEYIFQPIPPGVNEITWDDSFGVDVQWYEETGEPPWSLS